MEKETNEWLKGHSIASVKSMLDYAYDRLEELEDESKLELAEAVYYMKENAYWQQVVSDCRQELELRIKQIFP